MIINNNCNNIKLKKLKNIKTKIKFINNNNHH